MKIKIPCPGCCTDTIAECEKAEDGQGGTLLTCLSCNTVVRVNVPVIIFMARAGNVNFNLN